MMDELNVLNAPKKVVDGLVEVFDGLAQMFAGVSEQLDMLAADAKTEDEPELPVAEQPVLPVTEKKGPAVSHPRKKPVKKTKKVEEAADNNEKIGQLLKTYGVAQLSDLPAEKYEAFLADVSQI